MNNPPQNLTQNADVRFLGKLLGDVIRAHGGDALFERIEAIRAASVDRYRGISNPRGLSTRLDKLTPLLRVPIDGAAQTNHVLSQRIIFSVPGAIRGRVNALYMTSNFIGGALGLPLAGAHGARRPGELVLQEDDDLLGLALTRGGPRSGRGLRGPGSRGERGERQCRTGRGRHQRS